MGTTTPSTPFLPIVCRPFPKRRDALTIFQGGRTFLGSALGAQLRNFTGFHCAPSFHSREERRTIPLYSPRSHLLRGDLRAAPEPGTACRRQDEFAHLWRRNLG